MPLSELEDEDVSVDADNITLRPKDDEEAIPVREDEENLQPSIAGNLQDALDIPVSNKEFEPKPAQEPGLSVSPNTADNYEVIENLSFKDHSTNANGEDADFEQINPAILKNIGNVEVLEPTIVVGRTSTAQRPVSPTTLTPKKKREQQKYDRVSSSRSWDEIFQPRSDEDEEDFDAKSRRSNGDVETPTGSIIGSLKRRAQKKRAALPTFVFPSTEGMADEEPEVINR